MDILQMIPSKDLALFLSIDMIVVFGAICVSSILSYFVFHDLLEYKKFIKVARK